MSTVCSFSCEHIILLYEHMQLSPCILLLVGIWVGSSLGYVSVCLGCHAQRGFINRNVFSQCWRLDVQDQSVSRAGFSAASLLGLQMAFSPCVLTWPFLSASILAVSSSSNKKTSQIGSSRVSSL